MENKNNSAFGEVRSLIADRNFGAFFKGKTDNTLIQFFRYVFVGGMAAVFDWAISSLIFFFVFSFSGYMYSLIAFSFL